MATTTKQLRARVTKADIAKGVAGDCLKCAVSLALNRATGDTDVMVYERDWTMYLKVWSRHIIAPYEVRSFVHEFDGQPRRDDGRLDLKNKECEPPKPFAFTLPPLSSSEWEEECCGCEELFAPSELDDEGCCEGCREGSDG